MIDNCTADLGHPCDGGADGGPCERCAETENYYRRLWEAASPEERLPDHVREERYREDMIDAGRGHLLGDDR